MIAPLSYSAEARPYFTIHDSEFKEFTQRQQGPVPIILGVTNPFFSKTLQHWPHLIRMADGNNGKQMNYFLWTQFDRSDLTVFPSHESIQDRISISTTRTIHPRRAH